MNDCTVVVNTCDAYSDIWELFFCALKENWPNCPYKILINTEKKALLPDGVNAEIHNYISPNGVDRWGERFKSTLNSLSSEYVMMLYDDFIVEKNVNQDVISQCQKWLNDHKEVAVFYFLNNTSKNIDDQKFDGFERLHTRADYKLNSAPALWRRKSLLTYIEDDDNPWAWELFGSYRAYENNELFYCVKKGNEMIYPYNYHLGGAIYRGKWVESVVVPLIKKYKLALNLQKRGIHNPTTGTSKRSLKWKIDFFILGFRMIKFGVFLYAYRIMRDKILKRLQ